MSVNVFDLAARLEPLRSHVALFAVKWLGGQREPQPKADLFAAYGIPYGEDVPFEELTHGAVEKLEAAGYIVETLEPDGSLTYSVDAEKWGKLCADMNSLIQKDTDTP